MTNRQKLAPTNDGNSSAQSLCLRHIVSGKENGDSLTGCQGREVFPHCCRRDDIQPGCWLIEENQGRPVKQSTGYGQLLLHAPTPFDDTVLPTLPKAELLQQFLYARSSFSSTQPMDSPVQFKIILSAQLLVEARVFQKRSCSGSDLITLFHGITAEYLSPPAGRFEQAKQQMNGSCLAGTIGAQEAEDDPGRHLQRKAIQSSQRAKITGKVVNADGCISHDTARNSQSGRARLIATPSLPLLQTSRTYLKERVSIR